MQRWMHSAAGGTSQRLNPGPAMVRDRDSRPALMPFPLGKHSCYTEAGIDRYPLDQGLKCSIKADLTLDPHLVSRNPALEEVGQFLHVLQFHERERIAGIEARRQVEHGEALIRYIFQILAHLGAGHAHDAAGQYILGKLA